MFAQTFPGSGLEQFIAFINRFNVRHIRLAYGLALLITGVMGILAFLVLLSASAEELNIAEAIRLNTEQRMHMQRATLLLSVLSTSEENGSQDAVRTELDERLRLIEEDYAAFIQAQPSNVLPTEVASIYFDPANGLDHLLERFLELAQPMVDGPVESDNRDEIYQNILTISPLLREAYNQVILVYDDIDLELATSLRTFAFLFIVTLFIVLMLEVLVIFRPMEVRLRQQHEALTTEIERRKQTEAALRRSEASYRLLAQNLPDMAVLMFDHDLRYTLADGSALAAIGYSRERIEGKTLEESVSAAGYQMLEPYYRGTLQDQSAVMEHHTLGRDYFTQFVPVYDEQQKIMGGMVTSQDVTNRKQAEETIRLSEARFRSISENVTDMVALLDKDFGFVYANPAYATTLGYIPEQLVGKSAFDYVYFEDRDWLRERGLKLSQLNEKLDQREYRHCHADGHYLWVAGHISYLYDSKGAVQGIVSLVRDLTETHRLRDLQIQQAKLQTSLEKEQELSELKSQMMLRIAHEFRTPLAVIRSTFETLDHYHDRLTPEQRTTKRHTMNRQIQKLTRMLDDIGLAVRGEFAAIDTVRSTFDLMDLLKAEIVTVEAELEQQPRFALSVPTGLQVTGDVVSLKRAFHEILSNAARFSNQGTSIQVQAELEDRAVKVQITDAGIGIPLDEQARILTPFFRGSNINERGGLGLGLTLASDVITAHQGRLRVSSQEGAGTTVTVTLPA